MLIKILKKKAVFLNPLSLMWLIKPSIDKHKKANAWLIDVPIGFEIRSGCLPKSSYKKYPIRLPGNKYRMSKTIKEK